MQHLGFSGFRTGWRWQEDLPNLFRLPVAGEVRISHQPGSVMARTFHMVDLDQYVQGTNVLDLGFAQSPNALLAPYRTVGLDLNPPATPPSGSWARCPGSSSWSASTRPSKTSSGRFAGSRQS